VLVLAPPGGTDGSPPPPAHAHLGAGRPGDSVNVVSGLLCGELEACAGGALGCPTSR
jgi:hypothetical protein